ncbi:DUF4231 domain-containing protein [Curtobacterium sp. MCPF17_002]|uniref:DUF4231 domain-containing protein n=1 Tax=Curtobacterium sp. MCPF17_002 TaxID=2175645 RepID=UPI000DA775F8|nr:DUF4231 domain-containing protein [Curtobacterium sp. MCPF17_002]WIB77021.1 DUF4231 domain-containing protein [Curtobacterium sp. MCPF17_002]
MSANPLNDSDLPSYFKAADSTSNSAQRASLKANRLRLSGVTLSAVGGAFSLWLGPIDIWAVAALLGFVGALAAELFLIVERPDRTWYQSRALAESTKTLSWRFAVAADPFFPTLADNEAEALFRSRVDQVALQGTQSVAVPDADGSAPTSRMRRLRSMPFVDRKSAYLTGRTEAQRDWYTRKAEYNCRAGRGWRVGLIVAELVAIVLSAGRLFAGWDIDWAGILAAGIGAGAAWLALKQHATLRAAYSLTAAELQKQVSLLRLASEADWAAAVADAEEAISREHTTWLASRGEVNEGIS